MCPGLAFAFMALRAKSWICFPQLPYHPCKDGTHSTCFCSTGGHSPRFGSEMCQACSRECVMLVGYPRKTSTEKSCDTIATIFTEYEKHRCWASNPHPTSKLGIGRADPPHTNIFIESGCSVGFLEENGPKRPEISKSVLP